MILSDRDIKFMMKEKKLVIENFNEENLTPNGYDISIDEIKILGANSEVIQAKSYFVVSSIEYFKFPSNIAGQIWIKTSWARKGIILSAGMIDAGFNGKLNLFAYNSLNEIKIERGSKFAQVIFIALTSDVEKSYAERSGHYQGQNGIWI
ncbi:MAG: dCTP deaminase domain-containing protein [Thermoplasmata archaeon]|nr:dCTP deaminase [Thermoplasmata archaeon]